MNLSICCCAMALLLGCFPRLVSAHRYDIDINVELSLLRVRLCFVGAAPTALTSGSVKASSYIRDLRLDSAEAQGRVIFKRDSIELQNIPPNACLSYKVLLNKIARDRTQGRIGASRLIDIRTWLWRPFDISTPTQLYFTLPLGVEMAAPWPLLTREPNQPNQEQQAFLLPNTPVGWSGRVAFGRVNKTTVTVGDTKLEVSVVGEFDARQIRDVRTWVEKSASNIRHVYGSFPVDNAGVLVVGIGDKYGTEPVPWAEVQRSGRPEAHFFINQDLSLEAFLSDWTPTHELAHLLHPSIESGFKWVYEGLASYYQNVARARGGQLTQQQAWQKLYNGFQRGLKQSRQPDRRGVPKYMEIYWRGAAAALIADVGLRQHSHNRQSLDSALLQFKQCCFTPVLAWDGLTFFHRLDQITGGQVFNAVFGQYARSDDFPDVMPVFEDLGIRVEAGRVVLTHEGDWVALRTDLMRKR